MTATAPDTRELIEYHVVSLLSQIITIYPGIDIDLFVPDMGGLRFPVPTPQLLEETARHDVNVIAYHEPWAHDPSSLDIFIKNVAGDLPIEQRTFFLTIITERGTEDLARAMNVLDSRVLADRWPDALASVFRVVIRHEKEVIKQAILLTFAS